MNVKTSKAEAATNTRNRARKIEFNQRLKEQPIDIYERLTTTL